MFSHSSQFRTKLNDVHANMMFIQCGCDICVFYNSTIGLVFFVAVVIVIVVVVTLHFALVWSMALVVVSRSTKKK